MGVENARCPMAESAFRAALDPVAIVRNRMTAGGPQPKEMARMIALSQQRLALEDQWIGERRNRIAGAIQQLDRDFARLAAQ